VPILNYDGNTFVAVLDISGFKVLMQNEEVALKALDRLYQYGYETLRQQNGVCPVDGIFVSDGGVLFVRENNRGVPNELASLESLLVVIKELNERMISNNFMLTTSVAYGQFKYQERIEFTGIGKTPMYGNAYVSAFLDNENGRPRIEPGQCRIVKKDIPRSVSSAIESNTNNGILGMMSKRIGDNTHYYFYWNVDNTARISQFEQRYKDAYSLKYAGMLKALKG